MEVVKEKDEHTNTFDIKIKDGEKTFLMTFQGNLDLYLGVIGKTLDLDSKFTITKENYELYRMFDDLYNEIKEARVFLIEEYEKEEYEKLEQMLSDESEVDFDQEWIKEYVDEQKRKIEETRIYYEEDRKSLLERRKYERNPIYKDGVIEFHCDDYEIGEGCSFKIYKNEDDYIVDFDCKNRRRDRFCSVRIRNSGSNYQPYNVVFMRMFNKLQDYDTELHQVHMEELIYNEEKKLKRKY